MKIRKILMSFIAVSLSFLMAACSQESPTVQEPDTSESSVATSTQASAPSAQSEPSTEFPVKTEEEIIAELSAREDFFSLFDQYCIDPNGDFVGSDYEIEELTITRRKIDEATETDDVYITVTSNNGSSKYVGDFHLLYTLYDVGGWYLDNIELESGQLLPSFPVPDMEAYTMALGILGPLGEDTTDSYISEHKTVSNIEEIVVVAVDYNDGILSIKGTVELLYYHNGVTWEYIDYTEKLSHDILIDGTYEYDSDAGFRNYLVLSHENGWPVVRYGRVSNQPPGNAEVESFEIQNWEFDCLSRSYIYWGGFDGTVYVRYYFAPDGTIHNYTGDNLYCIFQRITDPITDKDALQEYLISTGRTH